MWEVKIDICRASLKTYTHDLNPLVSQLLGGWLGRIAGDAPNFELLG